MHLSGYEDWSPFSPDSGSGTSSDHGSSGPHFIPFVWTCGTLDGRQAPGRRAHAGGCRPPPSTHGRRHDYDDNSRRPGPRDAQQRPSMVRQFFPGCSSERSVRVRTRSPPSYRQAVLGGIELMERGRTIHRSPPRSGRERELIEHATVTEDWERRRSRSPPRGPPGRSDEMRRMREFVDPLEQGLAGSEHHHGGRDFDPMVHESQCAAFQPARCYSPADGDTDRVKSPVYVLVSDSFVPRSGFADTNTRPWAARMSTRCS